LDDETVSPAGFALPLPLPFLPPSLLLVEAFKEGDKQACLEGRMWEEDGDRRTLRREEESMEELESPILDSGPIIMGGGVRR
jgi:hypothetical protein